MGTEKVRICLFNPIPCVSYPPLNLTFLAAYLLKYGKYDYEIKLVDVNFSKSPIAEIINFKPDIIGFTALSPYMLDVYDFLNQLKKVIPATLIICGGAHATIAYKEVINKGFDLAIIGEGEVTFKEVVDTYIESGCRLDKNVFLNIDGLALKNSQNETVKTPERGLIDDLDSIGHPERGLLHNKGYHRHYYVSRGMNTHGVYTLHGARGCPYECIFCCVNFSANKRIRLHSPEYIADEVEHLVSKYKAKWIFFTDDTFFLDKAHARQVSELLIYRSLNKKVKWEVQIRSNLIKPQDLELLRLMRRAGCRQIDIGFESGNQRLLTLIKGEGITIVDNLRAMEIVKESGLKIMGTFILSTPTETESEMMDTVRFIKSNSNKIDRFQIGYMIPYPGTRLYELAVERGVIEDNYLNYLAKERNSGYGHGEVSYPDLIPEERARKVRVQLDNLSARKVNILEKIGWLLYNSTHNPRIAASGCRLFLKRSYEEFCARRRN